MEELMMEVLNIVAIIVAGLMVGNELAIAAFVHPTSLSAKQPRASRRPLPASL